MEDSVTYRPGAVTTFELETYEAQRLGMSGLG